MRRTLTGLILLALIASGVMWFLRRPTAIPHGSPAMTATPQSAEKVAAKPSRLAVLAAEIGPDATSPIAKELNAPTGSIRRDLEIVNELLVAWQTNFPRQGNPTGENNEIVLALAGENPLHFAFLPPNHPAINASGELCDRWGTPFRFHALSGHVMELRSAGPDRRFATADDVQFTPQ